MGSWPWIFRYIKYYNKPKKLVKKINLTKPDIVVFTGDLIDQDTKLTNEQADKMSNILYNIR